VDNLIIRVPKTEDAEDINRILKAITRAPDGLDIQQTIDEQSGRGTVASLVAEIDGRVVGYLISYILSGGFGIDKSAWIAMLGVDPKFMGQGIGKSLAKEILRFYKEQGIVNIFTSVPWDSTDLLSFFKTLGFDRSNFINLKKVLE
jgi:ribosomal protein S18 acetylase RimI-like enzyme